MRADKKRKLEERGWRVGGVDEFLGLTPEESAYVELKVSLAMNLKRLRAKHRMTQSELAELVSSSQSRVAKMEAGDSSVSIDLLIRSLLALGATRRQLAKFIGSSN